MQSKKIFFLMKTKTCAAILIDVENTNPSYVHNIISEVIELHDIVSIRRAYGDFTKQNLNKWKDLSLSLNLSPIQQFSYISKKGSSDMKLTCDAMDLLHKMPNINVFCIVTSDSDFTPLVQRLRESDKEVIGFGENKTSNSFVNACSKFIRIETLQNTTKNQKIDLNFLIKAVRACADDDGYSNMGRVNEKLISMKPDFDVRTYGFNKVKQIFNHFNHIFGVHISQNNTAYVYEL